MSEDATVPVHPVQKSNLLAREPSVCPQVVTMLAYEVYCEVFRPQPGLFNRGGFGVSELVAFLYAHNFPRSEWTARFKEALKGMQL